MTTSGGAHYLPFGWGVHIIEGPNFVALSWVIFAGLLFSFFVSIAITMIAKTQEQGFGVGQWLVAVFMAALSAIYFQWSET